MPKTEPKIYPPQNEPAEGQDVYAVSKRAQLAGLDPDFVYQLCNDFETTQGQPTEVAEKLAGYEYGFEGAGFTEVKWGVVPRSEHAKMQGARKRPDDPVAGTDTVYRTGGQILLKLPRKKWETMQALERKHLAEMDLQLTGSKNRRTFSGGTTIGAATVRGSGEGPLAADATALAKSAVGMG